MTQLFQNTCFNQARKLSEALGVSYFLPHSIVRIFILRSPRNPPFECGAFAIATGEDRTPDLRMWPDWGQARFGKLKIALLWTAESRTATHCFTHTLACANPSPHARAEMQKRTNVHKYGFPTISRAHARLRGLMVKTPSY